MSKRIQDVYSINPPEESIDAKLSHLFSNIKIKENIAVSVFTFDKNITS
ncbi:hypothetical protein NDK43_01150 [Neobacillus pocheonensis]|uniref:Uncharacterized protein n=1 Tax=Neobacillus pocheonensis TaxID=363869 RepID=A0ABT0W5B6_9BACI|nr:hypothetical protein [Neobacillus pocheonensis]